ncbi:MAG: thioredoxin-disulfide reductase [Tissierellia bacterium]|nr:thioredoxin-disulfide reductase [Tissierellia bacterium]
MIYDVIILGAGPAGLSAGIYAARANLKTLIIEKETIGGQIALTLSVDNYPGVDGEPSGVDITSKMLAQAERFGAEKVSDNIIEVDLKSDIKILKSENNEYKARAVILATGANPRKLGVNGEQEFTGKGVAYCATCDGPFYQGLEVYVIGGGDAAVEEAIFLTKFARKVTVIYRGDKLKAAKSIQEKAFANEKIHFIYNSEVREIYGDMAVNKIKVENTSTGEITYFEADKNDKDFGLFIFVGYVPNTELVKGQVELDRGYIPTDYNMKTNIPGVFAAGDVRVKDVRQVVNAAADGAIAAVAAEKYLEH